MRFRKIPVVINAARLTEPEEIKTLEGVMRGEPGDWVIVGIHGERYPCKHEIFMKTYEPADEDAERYLAEML